MKIIVVSGRIGVGKSTLCKALAEGFGGVYLSTSTHIKAKALSTDRAELQRCGNELDDIDHGRWVVDLIETADSQVGAGCGGGVFILDAARKSVHLDRIRAKYGRRVTHVHLTAHGEHINNRRASRGEPNPPVDDTEQQVDSLAGIADIVVDTNGSKSDTLARVAGRLGFFAKACRNVDVLVGGQYGSEGKGHIADYLSKEYDMLVRVGGPNAGHTVYEPPNHYVYYHLPSGTRSNPNSSVMLGPGAVINVEKLKQEIDRCELTPARLGIDPHAMIVSEYDTAFEKSLVSEIGSTGQGVGSASSRKLLRTSAPDKVVLAKDHPELREYVIDTLSAFDLITQRGGKIMLEGTQGTGLSIHHGRYPHVTSRDTSASGCLSEAGFGPNRVRKVIMVCRTYPIRVQSPANGTKTSGDMGREINWREVSGRAGLNEAAIAKAEITSTTKRQRRVAEFDWDMLRRAVSLNTPTDIALTFADYISSDNKRAQRYEQLTNETKDFVEEVERVTNVPVSLISARFHTRGIIDRRNWA